MSTPVDRPAAEPAPAELLVLQKWEEFTGWLLTHTGKWPKHTRFSLVSRLDGHALDVLEMLVAARYEPQLRRSLLRQANVLLERMRFLCRIASSRGVMPLSGFETAMRGLDECGRMLHGWRVAIGERRPTTATMAPAGAAPA
jgi:hypothetical protein